MREADARRRHGRPARFPAAAAGALLLGLLAGCSSSEASNRETRPAGAPAARQPQGTTDSGSRLVDMSAPLGGLTVETPPVRTRRR